MPPGFGEGWWYLGMLHYEADQYPDGRAAFRHLTGLKPEMALGWSLLVFFSSRRRHTRCSRDWSSDVCSSDLAGIDGEIELRNPVTGEVANRLILVQSKASNGRFPRENDWSFHFLCRQADIGYWKIGRASCRERV